MLTFLAEFGKEAEVLDTQVKGEGEVVVPSEDARCVVADDEAVADTFFDGMPQRCQVNAVRHPHGEPLAERCGRNEPELVGYEFYDVARAKEPHVITKPRFSNTFLASATVRLRRT